MVRKVGCKPSINGIKKKLNKNSGFESKEEYEASDEESTSKYLDGGNDFTTNYTLNKRNLDEDEDNLAVDDGGVIEENEHIIHKKKKKKKATTADIKPPTVEEMKCLRETQNLFHSNLFRMQIEEMIKELKPKKVERKQIKPWLDRLKELLLNSNELEKTQLSRNCLRGGIIFPLHCLPQEEIKATSRFWKPLSVSVIGSHGSGCSLGPSMLVDVVVVIPKKCFLKEDYLNARYHTKRALYLGHLASILQDSDLIDQEKGISWIQSCGSTLSPRLVVYPESKLNQVKVFISAIPEPDVFKLSRFTPQKNNIRESWLTDGEMKDCCSPCPLYNTSVMKDLVLTSNESIRQEVLENNNNVKDAITLLRVWLRQRQLDLGDGSFSGYLMCMLVVALLQTHRLNSLMSSYQIVRNVWLVLSQSDWTKEGFSMCNIKKDDNAPTLQDFHLYFDVVFVDTTGYCNLAASVHSLTYHKVKQDAQLAVQCLDNPNMNSFQALFMTPMPFLCQYDHTICIKKSGKIVTNMLKQESTQADLVNHFGMENTLFTTVVMKLLYQGLGERVDQMMFQLPSDAIWPVTDKSPKPETTLLIGLRLNAEMAFNVVEKGPPANENQAIEFRKLWGSRSELRRFRDGTVCEAVIWADHEAPLATRRLITKKITHCLLHERLGLPEHSVIYVADQLEPLITEKAFIPEGFEYGTGEEASLAVTQAFDRLAKQLRGLPDFPLDVASIQGVSAVFRGADVFPPLACSGKPQAKAGIQGNLCWLLTESPGKAPEYIAHVEGVLQLGFSQKWPENTEAVRRIRAAFNLHIAKALLEHCDLQTQAFSDYVDIFKEGFVFRVHIVYPREVVLLKETTLPDGKTCYRDTPQSLQLEKHSLHLPTLTGALHGLQQQWSGYGVTCRLAKRWLNAQLIDCHHFPDIATELLVASLFLNPEPYCSLAQPQPMFLRFLHLLAQVNWQLEPIIVNFNGDLKREDLLEIESQFRSERASLPSLFIATQYDKTGSVWTRDAPLLPVLVRLANLAKQSLEILESTFLRSALLEECKVVFRPPLELYDALIRLRPLQLPRLVHGVNFSTNSPYQLKIPQIRKKIPIAGFDPAQCYLQELRESYSDFALFFHDTYGGSTIGVLFKPSAFENHDFKVNQANCRKPTKVKKQFHLMLNFNAIIEDFYILGTGLVKSIDLNSKYSKNL